MCILISREVFTKLPSPKDCQLVFKVVSTVFDVKVYPDTQVSHPAVFIEVISKVIIGTLRWGSH